MTTNFPTRARPMGNPQRGVMTVQENLEILRDAYDKHAAGFAAGVGTVLQGNTTLVVNHGLLGVPGVQLTPSVNPLALTWWCSNVTATSFQINLSAAAPVGGVSFRWAAKLP